MTYKLKKPNDLYDFIIKNGKLQGYIGKSKIVIIPKLVTSIEKDAFFCNNIIVNIYIPHTITKISKRAFNHCLSLKNINVSKDNIKYSSIDGNLYNKKQTYLLQYATGKTNKQFIIPNTVKTINQSCFKHNLFLETIIMEKNVKEIKEEAFSNCEKVKSIKLSPNIKTINDNLFFNCHSLEEIIIPEGIKQLNNKIFQYCHSLKKIILPSTLINIGYDIFHNCNNLKNIEISKNNPIYKTIDGILYTKDLKTLIFYPPAKVDKIFKLPNTIINISDNAFDEAYNIKEVYIENIKQWTQLTFNDSSSTPICNKANLFINNKLLTELTKEDLKNITKLNKFSFYNCLKLKKISIPTSITFIDEYSFFECSSLKEVHIDDLSSWLKIKFKDASSNPLFNRSRLYINNELLTEITPQMLINTETISKFAFINCLSLEKITIPNNIKTIEEYAFIGCDNLKEVYYNDTLSSWSKINLINITSNPLSNNSKFYIKGKLLEIITKEDLKDISTIPSLFLCCYNYLKEIILPNNIKTIESLAFYECKSLKKVTISNIETFNKGAFINCPIEYINCPVNLCQEFNSNYLKEVVINSGNIIDENCFKNFPSLETISLPSTISQIHPQAFKNCKLIKNFIIDKDNPYFIFKNNTLYKIDHEKNKMHIIYKCNI